MKSITGLKPTARALGKSLCCLLLFSLTASSLPAVQPAVAAGPRHSLFLKSDGTAWTCGDNAAGQIGNGTYADQRNPVQVMTDVKAISGGERHSLFLKTDGTVWACGGTEGIGDGTNLDRNSPVQTILSGVQAISAGKDFSLFLKTDGTVLACGNNEGGRMGTVGGSSNTPVPVQISDVVKISAGATHSIFLKSNGTVWACGSNYNSQFGNGTNTSQAIPIQIRTNCLSVSASGNQTDNISLLAGLDGIVLAAGSNSWGQLGDSSREGKTSFVQSQISGVKSLFSFGLYSMFLKTDNTLWACGYNGSGLFGNGFSVNYYTVPIQIQTDILQVGAGYEHCLYLKKDGDVIAAGANGDGQLGDGTNSQRIAPVSVMSLGRMMNVTATTGGTVSGSGAYDPGTTATLTATPALGYLFTGWEGDATGPDNPLSVVMDSSKNVVAKFNRNTSDADYDGLSFYDEVVTHGTLPDVADTDGDGFGDGFEVSTGFNPVLATSSPDAVSSIRTAVEFRFNAANGVNYRIEASTDLESWGTIEPVILGQGGVVTRFYSTENLPRRFFRVRRN